MTTIERTKPSKRYIKHFFYENGEVYNPIIHNRGKNMYQRNIVNLKKPNETYYTDEEMKEMEREIKQARCPICHELINDETCRMCDKGHKFHSRCPRPFIQDNETTICPECRNTRIHDCGNYNDIFSGGKKSKRRNRINKRKTRRNKRKTRRNRRK